MLDLKRTVQENPLLFIMRNLPWEQTLDYARAAMDGGVRFFEVALNSPRALEQIALLRRSLPQDVLVGAGTAIRIELAQAAVEAGAQFLLSPSTEPDVLAWCREQDVAIMPGALTPSDVSQCLRYGCRVIKLFPAGAMPPGYVKSLKVPFEGTEYVAIGSVTAQTVEDYFRQGYLGVGIGRGLIPAQLAEAGDWAAASAQVAQITAKIRSVRQALAQPRKL